MLAPQLFNAHAFPSPEAGTPHLRVERGCRGLWLRQGDCKFLLVLTLLVWCSVGCFGRCGGRGGGLRKLDMTVVARRGGKVVGYYLEGLFAAQFLTNHHRIGNYFVARLGFRFSSFLVSFSRISGPIGGREIPFSETEGNWHLRGGRLSVFRKMEKTTSMRTSTGSA